MKRILTTLCAVMMALAVSAPALAADASEGSHYYPIEVIEDTEGLHPRIIKVYQLSLSDDPTAIPTEDFEREGMRYTLLDLTRTDSVGVDTRTYTQTVTTASDTDNMEKILKKLDATIETFTEDGYTGVLHLDHTTVKVTVDGYTTKTQTLSATRTYPNLNDADVSLIPKTIQDKGKTLTLADVKWDNAYQTEAEGAVMRYSATASYTGTSSAQYATGYTVTADYSGEVAKTGCDMVTYTATFSSTEAVEQPDEAVEDPQPAGETANWKRPLVIGLVAAAGATGGVIAFKKFKERV